MIFSKIFVKISSLIEAILHKYHLKAMNWSAFLFGFSFLIFCSCSTTRTIPIETIRKDTVYLSNIQYDSIYIYNNVYQDRSRDTLYIKEIQTEYRYKFLRDTIRIVQWDSIPYEVRIIDVKQVKYIPPWYKWLSAIGGIAVLLLTITLYQKLKLYV